MRSRPSDRPSSTRPASTSTRARTRAREVRRRVGPDRSSRSNAGSTRPGPRGVPAAARSCHRPVAHRATRPGPGVARARRATPRTCGGAPRVRGQLPGGSTARDGRLHATDGAGYGEAQRVVVLLQAREHARRGLPGFPECARGRARRPRTQCPADAPLERAVASKCRYAVRGQRPRQVGDVSYLRVVAKRANQVFRHAIGCAQHVQNGGAAAGRFAPGDPTESPCDARSVTGCSSAQTSGSPPS